MQINTVREAPGFAVARHIYLYLFNLQYMWVGPVVHKSKFLFMHNWTTVYMRLSGSKPEVSEDVFFSMNRECECRVLV